MPFRATLDRVLRRVLIGLVVLLAVAVAAGAYEVYRSGRSTPVSERAALAKFRSAGAGGGGKPAPGVYTYAVRGWECAGVGPVCVHRSLPPRAQLVVTRTGDELTLELDLSQQHLEAERHRVTPRGRLFVWQRTRISILGVTRDDAETLRPATLALPARPAVGDRWVQRFHAGGLPVVTRNTVIRSETADVGDRRIPCLLVVSRSVTGGAHPGTERDRDCQAQGLGLDAWFRISRDIGGVFPYRLEATGMLLAVSPAT